MEITKDNYYDVKYNERKNVLEVKKNKKRNLYKNNKIVTGVLSATAILVMINILLVYKFFEILCTL